MTDPPDFIYAGLGHLVVGTPGWTGDMAAESVDEYARQLAARCTLPDVFAAAIDQIITTWDQLARPTVAAILAAYTELLAHRPVAATPANWHCDGSGWVTDTDGCRPCSRCNPAVFAAWADRITHARWRNGIPLEDLVPGLRRTRNGVRYDGAPPPDCQAAPEPVASRAVGQRAFLRAYEADCRERGLTPKPPERLLRKLDELAVPRDRTEPRSNP
jgi:hypothetical protein